MGLRGPNANPVIRRPIGHGKPGPKPEPLSWQEQGITDPEKVIRFLETLPVTSGMLSGEAFRVRPFQREIVDGIYRQGDTGDRLVTEALITMPRKNGKTGLTSGLSLCHFIGPMSEERGQLYCGSAKRKQAAFVYEEMKAIILRVPWMKERVIIRDFNKQLEDVVTGSIFYALAAEASSEHGGSSSFWIFDELAQAKNRKLYDVLKTSTGARAHPLGIVISTQSHDDEHVMSQLVDDGLRIISGEVVDPSKYAVVYAAPMESDPWDEATWYACNPALGDFRSLQEMRDFAAGARRMPSAEATFRLLYLNQRVQEDTPFLSAAIWESCGQDTEEFDEDSLNGADCVGALDLSGSGKNDLTAFILAFDTDGEIKILPFFWAAKEGLEEAESRDRLPYRLWAKQGHLLTTPGKVLDYSFVAHKIRELEARFNIGWIEVDPYNIERMIAELEKLNSSLTLKKHGQYAPDMEPGLKAIENKAISGELKHNKNPVLARCMKNVMISPDSSGNLKFDKRKATGRIDGAVGLAMAMDGVTTVALRGADYSSALI